MKLPERGSAHQLSKKLSLLTAIIYLSMSCICSTVALANPVLDNVASGSVAITQTPTNTIINQSSQQAIINWQSFNIGQQESTHFQQPAGGIAFNRISPNQGASSIYGRLTATGKIILSNPAGIYFGPSAYVNVGGLIATTLGMSDQDFLNGNYRFFADPNFNGAVINQGTLIAADNGLVALVGGAVANDGTIQANMGKVVLASGDAMTMSFAGNDLISFTVDAPTAHASVTNKGMITADGGQVTVTARGAANVLDNVINLEGTLQAQSVYSKNGEIIISGDPNGGVIRVAAKVDASGKRSGEKGGKVTITGHNILLDSNADIDVSGDAGGGSALIGGNYQGKGPLPNANAVVFASGAKINADTLTNGDGGDIILWSNEFTNVLGHLSARGGSNSGNGGFIETSSKDILNVGDVLVDTAAPNGNMGSWLLDPRNVTITSSTSGGTFDGGSPTNTFTPTADGATVLNTTIQTNLGNTNVTINTGSTGTQNGDITVSSSITWTSTNTLKLDAAGIIFINAAISGVNGTLQLSAGSSSNITPNASGTINVANFTLQQGNWSQNTASLPAFNVSNDFSITGGSFLRVAGGTGASGTPYQITDVYGLQGIATLTMSNSYVLNNDIDAFNTRYWRDGAGWDPIGDRISPFTGTFDGQNYTIVNLSMRPVSFTDQDVGLFGNTRASTSSIKNLYLHNAEIIMDGTTSATTTGGSTGLNIGLLVGTNGRHPTNVNSGTGPGSMIDNVHVDGSITINNYAGGVSVGGMIGFSNGPISNSSANVDIYAEPISSGFNIGGLAGWNYYYNPSGTGAIGSIANTYSSGSITVRSDVSGGSKRIGGLVGYNTGPVSNSYSTVDIDGIATGGATTLGTAFIVGGLIGSAVTGSNTSVNIDNAYSSGSISATGGAGVGDLTYIGGSIGTLENAGTTPTVNNIFWDTETSGITSTGIGYTSGSYSGTAPAGITTAQMLSASYISGNSDWDISSTVSTTATKPSSTWFIFDGATRPLLMSQYSTNIHNAMQLQLAGTTLDADYTLANNIDLSRGMTNTSDVWATNRDSSTGKGFVPIGISFSANKPFTGTLDGNNYTISNLYIKQSGGNGVALIARTNPSVTISDLYLNNLYINNPAGANTGGLIGFADDNTTITNVYLSGEVIGTSGGNIGGVVGSTNGPITLSNVSSDVNVTTTTASNVGGLIGLVSGGTVTISNVYTIGSVTGGSYVGGLIGLINATTNVTNSYSTGAVSGSSNVGGLIGGKTAGTATITNSFWDIVTTGQTAGYGSVDSITLNGLYAGCFANGGTCATATVTNATNAGSGVTPVDLSALATYTSRGWTSGTTITGTPSATSTAPSTTWFIFNGYSRPILMWEHSKTISNTHQLQLASTALAASYTLANNIDLASGMTNASDIWGTNRNTPTGQGFVPIGISYLNSTPFTGSFNGNGYTISNLYINRNANSTGFISRTNTASISNLGLVNVSITNTNDNNGAFVGFGQSVSLTNVYATGVVTSTGYWTGGLVGSLTSDTGSITNSYANVNVTGVTGTGGLVGSAYSNTINLTNVYSLGSVTGVTDTGGLIGNINGPTLTVTNAYATGSVSGTVGNTGGFFGRKTGGTATINNSFWDIVTTGQTTGYGSANSVTVNGLYAGCFAGGGTCASATVTNATNAGSGITPVDLSLLATYTSRGWTSGTTITSTVSTTSTAPTATWFIFDSNTRPLLMSEYSTTITNAHQLQLMGSTLGGHYTLANDIDVASGMTYAAEIWGTNSGTTTGKGWVPIGNNTNAFVGIFDGQNYAIDGLYIYRASSYLGLFGQTGSAGSIQNLTLSAVDLHQLSGNYQKVGSLVGYNMGDINNVITSGNIYTASTNAYADAAGVVGYSLGLSTDAAILSNIYNAVNVTATTTGDVGGIIGWNHNYSVIIKTANLGNITTSTSSSGQYVGGVAGYNNDRIIQSFNYGDVTGYDSVGGVVGRVNTSSTGGSGIISNSYNAGNVTGHNAVGGVVGTATGTAGNSTISYSYSSGVITGLSTPTNINGFIGSATSTTITSSYWDVATSGYGSDGSNNSGATGKSTANMMSNVSPATYTGWDFTNTWNINEDTSYPFLRAFFTTAPRLVTGSAPTSGLKVTLTADGSLKDSTISASDGSFRFLAANNLITGINSYIANSSSILAFLNTNGGTVGNAIVVAPTSNGAVAITLSSNKVIYYLTSGTSSISNTAFSNALYDDSDVLFNTTSNLALNNAAYSLEFNVASGANLTYSGIYGGSGGLAKSNSGTLILSAANTYTGKTTVSAGTLSINTIANVSGGSSALGAPTTAGNGTIDIGATGILTYTGSGHSSNRIINLTASGGTINASGSGAFTLSGGITGNTFNLVLGGTGSGSQSGVIATTSGTLTKQDAGTWTLSGANTYTGTTTISAGTLRLGAAGVIADTSAITLANISGAIFDLNGNSETIGTLSGGGATGGNISLGAATLTVTQGSDQTYAGIISGSGGLTKAGSNALILSGANTYTDKTTISAGTLSINTLANVSGGSSALGAPTTAGNGTIDIGATGILTYAGSGHSSNRIINLTASGGTVNASGSGALTLSGGVTGNTFNLILGGTGNGSQSGVIATTSGTLTKQNAGTWTISGANTYTGKTTISAGTLSINTLANVSGGSSALGAPTTAGNGTIDIGATGILTYTGSGHSSNRVINLTASGGTINASGSGAFTLSGGVTGNTFNLVLGGTGSGSQSGVIATTSGTLTKQDAGTWTLSGANTYSGKTTISAGTLSINTLANVSGGSSALGAPTTAGNGTIDIGATGILTYTGSGHSSNRIINLTASGGTVNASGSGALTLSGGVTGNTFNLVLGGTGSGSQSGVIATTSGTLTKQNAGTWTISGANTYTGKTTISAGTLSINTLANVSGGNSALGAPTTSGNGTIDIGATGILTYTGSGHSSDRVINLTASGGTVNASGSGALTLSGGVTGNTFNLILGGTGIGSQSGVIATTSGTLTKQNAGTWTISGANTYTGKTTISAGTLSINTLANVSGGSSALGAPTTVGNGTIDIGATGILTYTGSGHSSNRIINLTASGAIVNASGSSALTLSGGVTGNTFNLVLGGSGSGSQSGVIATTTGTVTKQDAGTWTLSGANTYSGKTTISAGTLSINTIANVSGGSSALGAPTTAGNGTIDIGSTGILTYTGSGHSSDRIINLTASGGTVNASGSGALTLSGGVTGNTFNLVLGGTGSGSQSGVIATTSGTLTKQDAGTWTLTGNNSYSGGTTFSAGTLIAGHDNALGTNTLTFANGGNGTLVFSGNRVLNNNITFTGAGIIDQNNTASELTGSLSGSGGVTFNNTGGSNLTSTYIFLSDNSSLSGTVTLNAGTIGLRSNNAFGTATLNIYGGNIRAEGAARTITNNINAYNDFIIGRYTTLNGNLVLNNNITLYAHNYDAPANGPSTIGGAISEVGGSRSLTINEIGNGFGSGYFVLSGSNTYTGKTTIAAGSVYIDSLSNVSGGSSSLGAPTTVGNGTIDFGTNAALTYTGSGHSSDRVINLTANGGKVYASGSGALTLTGGITGNSFNLVLGGTGSGSQSGVITTTGTVTKQDAGTWILSGANTYSGKTTISAGILSINTLANVSGGSSALGTPTTVGDGTIDIGATGILTYTGSGHSSDRIINLTASGGTVNASGSGALTLSGGVTGNTFNLVLGGSGSASQSGVIAITSGTLTKQDAGTWTLSGANTYSSKTTISAGTLSINTIANVSGGSSALGAPITAGNGTIDIGATGILTYTGSGHSSDRIINLTASGGTVNASGSGTITLAGGVTGNTYNLVLGGTGLGIVDSVIATTTGGVTKQDAGTWTLSGVNTYSGATNINAGILNINAANNLGATSSINFNGGSFQSATSVSLSGALSLGSGTNTIQVGSGNTTTFSGTISGTGSLTKSDTGTLILSGNNTYSGATILSAGTLTIASASGLGNTSSTTIASGTTLNLNVNGIINNSNTINLNGGTINLSGTNSILANAIILGANSAIGGTGSATFNNAVSDGSNTYSLTKSGTSTLTLGSANTYKGGTIISGGTLKINNSAALGTTGSISISSGTLDINFSNTTLGNTNTLTLNGDGIGNNGALTFSSSGNTLNNAITIASDSTIGGSAGATFAGAFSGVYNVTFKGGNIYNLNANSASFGDATHGFIVSGTGTTLKAGANNALGSSSTLATVQSGATLGFSATGLTIANTIALTGSATLADNNAGTNTLSGNIVLTGTNTINSGASSNTSDELKITGTLTGTNATITKAGVGLLTLVGNNASTLTGTSVTNVTQGSVALQHSSALGASTASASVSTGAALILTTISGTASSANMDIANAVSLSANSTLYSTNTTSSTNSNKISGNINIGSNAVSIITNNGLATETFELAGNIIGSGTISKSGSGILTLSNNNSSFSGITRILAGTAKVTNSGAFGTSSASNAIQISGGATLNIAGASLTINKGITLSSNANITTTAGSNSTISGNIRLAGTNNISAASGDTLTLSGVISQSATALNLTGPGTVVLSNTNTFSAPVNINNGTLRISSASGANANTINVASTGTLDVAANITNVINLTNGTITASGTRSLSGSSLSLSGTNNIFNISGTLTLTASDADALTGSGSFTKSGTGTLAINKAASNSFTGGITLSNGILEIGATDALGTTATNTFTLNGGTLRTSVGAGTTVVNNIVIAGNADLSGVNDLIFSGTSNLSSGSLTVSNSATTTLAGNVSGSGNLIINNAGTVVISGSNNSSFSGNTTLTTGTLRVGSNSTQLGTGTVTLNGGTLQSSGNASLANSFTIDGNATIGGNTNDLSFSGNFFLANSSTLNLTSASSKTFAGALSGSGDVSQAAGTVTFSGNNIGFSGDATINGGTMVAAHNNAVGSSTITINDTGTFNVNNVSLLNNPIILNGGTLLGSGTNASIGGAITLSTSSDNTISVATNGVFTLNNNIDGAADLTFTQADSSTGSLILNGDFGTITTLNSVTYDAPVTLGGTITKANYDIAFNSPVNLVNDSYAESFFGNVSIGASFNGNFPFTVISHQGNAIILANIGDVTPVSSVVIESAKGIEFAGGVIASNGTQTYSGPVLLNGDTTFTSTHNQLITINGAVSSGHALLVNAGTNNIVINDNVTSVGTQTYNSPVLLGSNVSLTGSAIHASQGFLNSYIRFINNANGTVTYTTIPLSVHTTPVTGSTQVNHIYANTIYIAKGYADKVLAPTLFNSYYWYKTHSATMPVTISIPFINNTLPELEHTVTKLIIDNAISLQPRTNSTLPADWLIDDRVSINNDFLDNAVSLAYGIVGGTASKNGRITLIFRATP